MARENRLLHCLSEPERDKLMPRLESVSLRRGQELQERDAPITHVYFPVSGVCSCVVGMASGENVEAATVGNEGMLGCQAYLDVDVSMHTTVAQVDGSALRLPVEPFREALRQSPELESLVRRYVAYTLSSANQTLACNGLHSVEERACRWLLMMHDRVGRELRVTHEMLAEMLGIHRQTVSVIAGTLQRDGLIHYRRGVLHIADRAQLEQNACECYGVTTRLFEHLVRCP
jgi:CRP-like cAMP-binding protein